MFKKTVAVIFTVVMVISMSLTSFAASNDAETNDQQTIYAKTAHVKDINKNGTNLTNDRLAGDQNTIADTLLKINRTGDQSLIVTANINGEDVAVSGTPIGRSENGKVVFYKGESAHPGYSVVYFAYEENLDAANMYFLSEKEQSDATGVLKLYLKDEQSATRDYILLESFEFSPDYSDAFISGLTADNVLGAWAATQFEPISSSTGEVKGGGMGPMAVSSTKNWYHTITFFDMGENSTHTIKWSTSVDYSDVKKGQEALQYYRITVTGKNMTFTVNTNMNSNTASYLHVNAIRLDQTSVPYTAWKSTSIDGSVQDNGWGGGTLSARIGVSYGVLGLAYSIPISFTAKGNVDINTTYNSYENANNNYTRSIETKIDSNYKLTQIGHYFEVASMLRDYGNATRSSQSLQAKWYVDIINASNMSVTPLYCDHNVSVAVVN